MGAWRASLAALGAVTLAAGCGSGATNSTSATTRPSPAVATTTAPTATATSPTTTVAAPAWSTTSVSVPGRGETALLVGVRAAAQDGFDRVTFEFANQVPGYAVDYVERPILADGSGTEVAVEGAAALAVRMTRASGFDLSAGGGPTYTGPKRITPATSTLAELVQVGDFEGTLTWVAGVRAKKGFKVSVLESPPRLVVDIETG